MSVSPATIAYASAASAASDVLPIQPTPIKTKRSEFKVNGRTVTALTRKWKPGDPARCGLCRKCVADADNECLIQVGLVVPAKAAPLFSTVGLHKQGENYISLRRASGSNGTDSSPVANSGV